MAHFTTLDQSAVEALAAQFELGHLDSWKSIAAGTINSNFRLETSEGLFFLRINEGKSEEQVDYEIAVLQCLVDEGVPTPMPCKEQGGKRYAMLGGKPVSVFAWLPGYHLDSRTIGPDQCRAVGRSLATLHRAGARSATRLMRESRYSLPRLRELFESFSSSTDSKLQEVIATLRAEFSWLDSQRARRDQLTQGLIHADLFPDNVLLLEGEVGALLDFEQACTGALIYDLAVTINAWCFAEVLDAARMRAMVEGYQETQPLAAREMELLGTELRASALRFTITRVTDIYLGPGSEGGGSTGKDFGRFLMRLEPGGR